MIDQSLVCRNQSLNRLASPFTHQFLKESKPHLQQAPLSRKLVSFTARSFYYVGPVDPEVENQKLPAG